MALKPTRRTVYGGDIIQYFMDVVAEAGAVVVHQTSSTGLGGLDDPNSVVTLPSDSGGVPVGVLMNNVVNLDLTRQHLNEQKDEVQINGKVAVLQLGEVRTNLVKTGDVPSPGLAAHYTTDGEFTTGTASVTVGRFVSALDADGYVAVDVRL